MFFVVDRQHPAQVQYPLALVEKDPQGGGNMAYVPRTAFSGTLIVNATAVATLLFDLAPAAMRALKREQEGFAGVLSELSNALTKHGATIGVASDIFQKIQAKTTNIGTLRSLRDDAKKLVEVLEESIALQEDEREAELSMLSDSVKRAVARKDPGIEGAFEKLLVYVAQVGVKAAATRRKNEEAAETNAPAGDEPNKPG
jgi:hypothetical protein